jgi:hypothetical protein
MLSCHATHDTDPIGRCSSISHEKQRINITDPQDDKSRRQEMRWPFYVISPGKSSKARDVLAAIACRLREHREYAIPTVPVRQTSTMKIHSMQCMILCTLCANLELLQIDEGLRAELFQYSRFAGRLDGAVRKARMFPDTSTSTFLSLSVKLASGTRARFVRRL